MAIEAFAAAYEGNTTRPNAAVQAIGYTATAFELTASVEPQAGPTRDTVWVTPPAGGGGQVLTDDD